MHTQFLAQQAKSNGRSVCMWILHTGVQLHCGRGFDTKRMKFDSKCLHCSLGAKISKSDFVK